MLVYTSDILKEPVAIAGPVRAKLQAATDGPDTDWFVKLVDLYPNGFAMNIAEGILRARFRKGFDRMELLKPNEAYEFEIDMRGTANVFLPGHRIRRRHYQQQFPSIRSQSEQRRGSCHRDASPSRAPDCFPFARTRLVHPVACGGGSYALAMGLESLMRRSIFQRMPRPTSPSLDPSSTLMQPVQFAVEGPCVSRAALSRSHETREFPEGEVPGSGFASCRFGTGPHTGLSAQSVRSVIKHSTAARHFPNQFIDPPQRWLWAAWRARP